MTYDPTDPDDDGVVESDIDNQNTTTQALDAEVLGHDTVNITERYLAADGSTDDSANLQSAIESEEGRHLVVEEDTGVIKIDAEVAPTTSGETTVLEAVGGVTVDISDASATRILNFTSANNVELRGHWTITGTTGSGKEWSVAAGTGFRFDTLDIDGGQGGFDITNISDVRGDYLDCNNLHDTDTGIAACLHTHDSDDVEIGFVRGENADRGIETEDGTTDLTVSGYHLKDIDNSQATSPETQFVLDAHNHTGENAVENITYGEGVLENCARGPTVAAVDGPDHVDDVTIRKLRCVNCDALAELEGGVTIHEWHVEGPTTPARYATIGGGNVTINKFDASVVPSTFTFAFANGDVAHGHHHIANVTHPANTTTLSTAIKFETGASVKTVYMEDVKMDGQVDSYALDIDDNGLVGNGAGYAGEFVGCDFDAQSGTAVQQSGVGNAPILMNGGYAKSTDINVQGTRFEGVEFGFYNGVDGVDGVIFNGRSTNSGDPNSTGYWNGDAAVAWKHGVVVEDTSTSPSTFYRADDDEDWVAI